MISNFNFECSVVFKKEVPQQRPPEAARPLSLQLPLWIPDDLFNLKQVPPKVQEVVAHFAPLNLGWRYLMDPAAGGMRVTGLLKADPYTGEVWELSILQRAGTGRHRHNKGGLYGECVITLAGALDDILDDGVPVRLQTGAVMFHAVDTVHEAWADDFWVGLCHWPRGATSLG